MTKKGKKGTKYEVESRISAIYGLLATAASRQDIIHYCSEKGFDVSIYERNDRVGGMCASFKWNDFILDIGPHIFQKPKDVMYGI